MASPAIPQFTDPDYLNQVYASLLNLLSAAVFAGGLKLQKAIRAMEAPDQVAAEDQPALILINGPIGVVQKEFALAKVMPTAIAVIYLWTDGASPFDADPNNTPATQADRLVWGIFNAFNTQPPYQKQGMGGIVYHAWIEGDIHTEIVRQQVVITIPIRMLAGPYG